MLPAFSSRLFARRNATGFRRLNGEEGSGLVEYALIFVLLMTMLLGIMEFAAMLYDYHFVSNAAREATRWAAVNGSACSSDGSCTAPVTCGSSGCTTCTTSGCASAVSGDITNYVEMLAVPAGINTSSACGSTGKSACLTTTPSWPVQANGPTGCSTTATQNEPGCTVQVQVSYSFNFLLPLVHISPVTLSSTSEMVIVH
jgi:Flp pilus assembly protein TadG